MEHNLTGDRGGKKCSKVAIYIVIKGKTIFMVLLMWGFTAWDNTSMNAIVMPRNQRRKT